MAESNRMKEMPVNKLMVQMGIPMILSMALQAVYNIVDRGKYLEQIEKILELREKSEQFYFSYIHNSNVYSELNELYFWRDACLGKEKNEIYVKIGTPDKHIQLIFENEVCTEVRRI